MPRLPRLTLIALALLAACLAHPPRAHADAADAETDDPAYDAAVYLLRQATRTHRDGLHHELLQGLRRHRDPALVPFYNALTNSRFTVQRVHGLHGLAETREPHTIPLATLAEIEDQAVLPAALGAAIDDDKVAPDDLRAMLGWQSLKPGIRLAIALRLVGMGEPVDADGFRELLDVAIDDPQLGLAAQLNYGLAALLLASQGDAEGEAALLAYAELPGPEADAARAQVLSYAGRAEIKAAVPLALKLARDEPGTLGNNAVNTALQMDPEAGAAAWLGRYEAEPSVATRTRLALQVLAHAPAMPAAVWDALAGSDSAFMKDIAEAGRAVATGDQPWAEACAPLVEYGLPRVAQLMLLVAMDEVPADEAIDLYALAITGYAHATRRGQRDQLVQTAIDATQALAERHPERAVERLPELLGDPSLSPEAATFRRQVVLMGVARAPTPDLALLPFVESLDASEGRGDFTCELLHLLLRSTYGLKLTEAQWQRVGDIVQGVGAVSPALRIRLAWQYLKHTGTADRAIAEALRG